MPFVQLKIVREQVSPGQKRKLVDGLMDIITGIMQRERDLTVITVDELDASNWIIGGKPLAVNPEQHGGAASVQIKISKGTSNPEEMAKVMQAGKSLIAQVLGQNEMTNYFIIEELNPDGWGFDGMTMTEINQKEKQD
ncbi:tautomerase family protein [bacterium]|nr:tautomerase family protein [bacterium]